MVLWVAVAFFIARFLSIQLSIQLQVETAGVDLSERAYQLDTGNTGTLLSETWWMSEVQQQMRREQNRERMTNPTQPCTTFDSLIEVTLSTCTPCPVCRRMIYDEEIMAGWKVFSFLNATNQSFRLKIKT